MAYIQRPICHCRCHGIWTARYGWGVGGQTDLQGDIAATDDRDRDDGFYTYVPAKFVKVNSGSSQPAQASFTDILSRVKRKEASQQGVDAGVT